ncbi:hypothetical protein [Nocardioides sp.]|uniref:hypothetical protein n=1 Tax=Nocardioides sp. TaxID=35761 RepID=UPI0039E4ED8C
MPRITVTDAAVRAEAERRGITADDLTGLMESVIRRDLAQARADAINAAKKPPATTTAEGPDHLTITVEITHGDRVLGVTQQHVAIPRKDTV